VITLPELKFSRYYKVAERKAIDDEIPGIYLFLNDNYDLMYIGKSINIKSRIYSHLIGTDNTQEVKHNFKMFRYAEVKDPVDREIYETYYINLWKPKLNRSKTLTYRTSFFDKKYNIMAEEREKAQKELDELAYAALVKSVDLR